MGWGSTFPVLKVFRCPLFPQEAEEELLSMDSEILALALCKEQGL
jgi:hypothetical protein